MNHKEEGSEADQLALEGVDQGSQLLERQSDQENNNVPPSGVLK